MPEISRRDVLKGAVTLLVTIALPGCGDSDNDSFVGSYGLRLLPLDNNVLTLGFNQVFAVEITAFQDMTIDALVVDVLASPTVDIAGVEIRDETTQTLGNSVLRFGFIPIYPLRLSIPVNQFVLAGKKKILVVYADVVNFTRANNLQVILLDIAGTTSGGALLLPLGAPIQGPTKVSNA